MCHYGYIGVYIYEGIQEELKINPEQFIENILDFYYTKDSDNKLTHNRNILINNFPKQKSLKELIGSGLITKKEMLLLKVIFDLYFNYYKDNVAYSSMPELLTTIAYYYMTLSDEDYKYIIRKLKENVSIKSIYSKFANNLSETVKKPII
jgi:hypothetical protein